MLKNRELRVNQGARLKLKLGNERYENYSRTEVFQNRTIGKPLISKIVE
jgi:hypothetical protein